MREIFWMPLACFQNLLFNFTISEVNINLSLNMTHASIIISLGFWEYSYSREVKHLWDFSETSFSFTVNEIIHWHYSGHYKHLQIESLLVKSFSLSTSVFACFQLLPSVESQMD